MKEYKKIFKEAINPKVVKDTEWNDKEYLIFTSLHFEVENLELVGYGIRISYNGGRFNKVIVGTIDRTRNELSMSSGVNIKDFPEFVKVVQKTFQLLKNIPKK
jgi:hypothetical protein